MSKKFYRTFEDKFRGPRELIKSRLQPYLSFIQPLLTIYPDGKAIDLGCGRGEWLELLLESGFSGHGVDLDDQMLETCRELGLSVTTEDAISALKALPAESVSVVSGFHIAEHLQHQDLQILVLESFRVLRPAGLLILETPNPENLIVSTSSFHLDPSHVRPIPIALLSFIMEHSQFDRIKVVRLQESPDLQMSLSMGLLDVLGGASPDFGVVGQKAADSDLLKTFDAPFIAEYGVSQEQLCQRYDLFLKSQIEQAIVISRLAESRAENVERQLLAIYSGYSWHFTVRLRRFIIFLKRICAHAIEKLVWRATK
jgi:SAM-dependent methyltransferase